MEIITRQNSEPDITQPEVVATFMAIESMLVDQGYSDPYNSPRGYLRWDKMSWGIPLGVFMKDIDTVSQKITYQRYLLLSAEKRKEFFPEYLRFISSALIEMGKIERFKANRAAQDSRQ